MSRTMKMRVKMTMKMTVKRLLGFGSSRFCYLRCLLLLLVAGCLLFTFQLYKLVPGINLESAQQPRERQSPQFQQTSGAGSFPPDSWEKLSLIKESRRQLITETCAKYKSSISKTITPDHVSEVFVEDKYKVLYCGVPKAGSSNWKRTLLLLAGEADNAKSIGHEIAHAHPHLRKLSTFDRKEILHRLKTYTKIIFVREPFERMVSAYRDKFQNPETYHYYHPVFGTAIIARYRENATEEALATGDGVTFKEFAQYLQDDNRPLGLEYHWNLVSDFCHPCVIDYDFIGKFENMVEESKFVLQLVGAPPNLVMPTFKDRNVADKKTSFNITKEYFSQISLAERQKIYDFYYMDYLMFNFSKPFHNLF